ncbi:MAG: hypothetical protein JW932_19620 [Deltaproteobacteria bacterium]|nr:hypothetical protein [Deltaproteobacteria bacterium]
MVRDLARKAGKEVDLLMFGQETEIDRNAVEEFYEPMVHMIRNAIDHGIEFPDEREKIGKPRRGASHLKAYHLGANIILRLWMMGEGWIKKRLFRKQKQTI